MKLSEPSMVITDDDRDFRETLRQAFEPAGFRTFLASDGEEALQIVRERSVHLMLLDMHMPRLDGLETARTLKKFRLSIPCILVSAKAEEVCSTAENREEFFSYVNKPVRFRELLEVVQAALQSSYE